MLTKTHDDAAAPANADDADQLSVNRLKPFAETLAEKLVGSAKARRKLSGGFLVALEAWRDEVLYDRFIAARKAIQEARDSVIALREQALHVQERLGRTYPVGFVGSTQDQDPPPTLPTPGQSGLPSIIKTIEATIEAMEAHLREWEKLGIEHKLGDKPRGRPSGISGYPQLENLVFNLEGHSQFHGAFLTAYVKKNGELKVAAGSLIDALNMLRSHLMNGPVTLWSCMAKFLPLPDEHLTYISTYQRILADARIEAREQQAASH